MNFKLLLTCILLILFSSSLSSEEKFSGNLGYLTDGLDDFKKKDTRLAFRLWVQELADDESIAAQIHYYESEKEIMEAYKNFDVNHISLNPYFFLKNYASIKEYSSRYWMLQVRKELFEDYLILVHKKSNIKSIKDLKNKTIMTRGDDYMGRVVLDNEILKVVHTSATSYIDSYLYIEKFSTAVLKTYFGKVDVCIVPSYTYDTMVEMNPDIAKKLVILHREKDAHVYMVGAFQKDTSVETMELYKKNVNSLNQNARGRNILNLFKIKKILEINLEHLFPLIDYYNDYITLKKKYGAKNE